MTRLTALIGTFCAAVLMLDAIASAQQRGTAQQPGAQQPGTPPQARGTLVQGDQEEVIIRSYDISDLVRTNANYPSETVSPPLRTPGGNPFQGGTPPQRPASASDPDALMKLIQSMVSPDQWRDNGGSVGTIRSLGTILVVQQTRRAQDQVQQMLDDLRRILGPMQVMTVHATWVLAAPGALPKAMTEASDDWMSKQKVFCESQITCFSGQTVHVISGTDRSYVSDVQPVVASSAVAFDPTISSISSGAVLQISPQVVPGTDDAIIDIGSIVTEPAGPAEPPINATGFVMVPGIGGGEGKSSVTNATIERVNVVSQKFRTTARVPLKKRTIVGGMTLNPTKPDDGANQLYLVIEVTTGK